MTDPDSAQLKLVFTQLADEAGTFEPPPFETWHGANTGRRGYRTGLLAGLAATVVAALAVVLTVSQNGHEHSASPPPEVRSSPMHNPTSSQLPDDYPVVPGHVALYLDLSRTAAPANGTPVPASLHLVNGLGRTFVVPGACNGWLLVGLDVDGEPPALINGAVACGGLTVSTGTTVINLEIRTTFSGCSQDPNQATATNPYCEGPDHNQAPKLRPGRYQISIVTSGVPSPVSPRPQSLTLTPS